MFVFKGAWSPTVGLGPHGLPLIILPLWGAQREVITLSPNRKPHRKGIMFLHKAVKERAAKLDVDRLLSITDDKTPHARTLWRRQSHNASLRLHSCTRLIGAYWIPVTSTDGCRESVEEAKLREASFSQPGPSLLTFDQSLQGKTLQSPPRDQVRGGQPCGPQSNEGESAKVWLSVSLSVSDTIHKVDGGDLC